MTGKLFEDRELATCLLDDPIVPSREEMADDALAELERDIRRHGILLPLIVKRVGDRYEIVAGHRRLICARAIGLLDVPCRVLLNDQIHPETIKAAENLFREQLTAAEEATYCAHLLAHECGGDIERLAALMGKSVAWLDQRFDLLRGDALVLEKVRSRELSLSVARVLNRFPSAAIPRYVDAALSQGATARVVSDWLAAFKRDGLDAAYPDTAPIITPSGDGAIVASGEPRCYLCDGDDDQHELTWVPMHTSCKVAAERRARGRAEGT